MANATIATKYGTAPRNSWTGVEKIPLDVSGADGVGLASTLKTYMGASPALVTPDIGSATGASLVLSGNATAAQLQLGAGGTATGQLNLANSTNANVTTLRAGVAGAARTYTWPTNFGAAGTVLTDVVGNGNLSWQAAPVGTRTVLSADQTYYISPTGNDSTGTGAVGAPWATPQQAYNYIALNLDANGHTVTVQCADGTYTSVGTNPILSAPYRTKWINGGTIVFQGHAGSRTAVIWQIPSANDNILIATEGFDGDMRISDIKLVMPIASTAPLLEHKGGALELDNIDVAGGTGKHYSVYGWNLNIAGTYTITGGNPESHIHLADRGYAAWVPSSVTVPSSMTFTKAFLNFLLESQGDIQGPGTIATVHGRKFYISSGAVLNGYNYESEDYPGDLPGILDGGFIVQHFSGFSQSVGLLAAKPTAYDIAYNTYAVVKDTAGNGVYMMFKDANGVLKPISPLPFTFTTLPTPAVEGMLVPITDSNVNTFNTAITASGANHGMAYYNGTAWVFR